MAGFKEELLEVLGSAELVDKVSAIIGSNMIPKDEYKKVNDKYKELSTEHEKIKIASMSEAEKFKLEQEQIAQMKREYGIKLNTIEVERLFAQNGLAEAEYKDFIGNVVSDDKETSIAFANKLVGVLNKQKQTVESKTKEALLNQVKSPETGDAPITTPTHATPKMF